MLWKTTASDNKHPHPRENTIHLADGRHIKTWDTPHWQKCLLSKAGGQSSQLCKSLKLKRSISNNSVAKAVVFFFIGGYRAHTCWTEDRCTLQLPYKQWFPHASVSVITCCTQRNQALLWTSLPQTHRWGCYYSSLLEFSGKEGLALWHTSCPLKSPTERWLSRPSFQTPALMAAWKETSGV